MTNERLRGAMITAGVTPKLLGERIGVDTKTVERWISTERRPHTTHRRAAAVVLSADDQYLWPIDDTDPRSRSASRDEFVAIYPNRGSIPLGTWTSLIDSACESIDLLAFAGSFLHDAIPDFTERLRTKARNGVQVRLLFGDPASDAVRLRGEEEGIGDLLSARCRLTWSYYQSLLAQSGVSARRHGSTLYASIFRFDDTILANTHLLGAAASQSPVVHVQRLPGGRLFANYLQGFDRTWQQAEGVST